MGSAGEIELAYQYCSQRKKPSPTSYENVANASLLLATRNFFILLDTFEGTLSVQLPCRGSPLQKYRAVVDKHHIGFEFWAVDPLKMYRLRFIRADGLELVEREACRL